MIRCNTITTTRILYNVFETRIVMFGRGKRSDKKNATKCDVCGTELHEPERLKRHMKKAHGNVPAKKLDPNAGDGGMW